MFFLDKTNAAGFISRNRSTVHGPHFSNAEEPDTLSYHMGVFEVNGLLSSVLIVGGCGVVIIVAKRHGST